MTDQNKEVIFRGTRCRVEIATYPNGRPAIQLFDAEEGMPYARASVNLPETRIRKGFVFIKNTDENTGMLDCLVEGGIVRDLQLSHSSGFSQFELCELLI